MVWVGDVNRERSGRLVKKEAAEGAPANPRTFVHQIFGLVFMQIEPTNLTIGSGGRRPQCASSQSGGDQLGGQFLHGQHFWIRILIFQVF